MDNMLSQNEINALIGGIEENDLNLTYAEKDAIGEISNINMGTAATTLSSLLNQKVTITTPVVSYATWSEVFPDDLDDAILVQIEYKEGVKGQNALIVREEDAKIMTRIIMGSDMDALDEEEVGELHLSAISEIMNQMMGSAATSLSAIVQKKIDIKSPMATKINRDGGKPKEVVDKMKEPFVKVMFDMEIEGHLKSYIMQLFPIEFVKEICEYMNVKEDDMQMEEQIPAPKVETRTQTQPVRQQQPYVQPQTQSINVQPVQFAHFAMDDLNPELQNENIDLVMDVPLEVTVELGRTNRTIKEVLEFKPGTIIELNKVAGEPVDILVNGKFVAKGEVVVIDECFGIRVTDILK